MQRSAEICRLVGKLVGKAAVRPLVDKLCNDITGNLVEGSIFSFPILDTHTHTQIVRPLAYNDR